MNTRKKDFLVPYISTDRNYWLVRTKGGKYYESFLNNEYIGISWNELDNNFLNQRRKTNPDTPPITKEEIKDFYEQKYIGNEEKQKHYSRNAQRIATMINRFVFDIKKGDIVLIPSANSDEISFGEVLEDGIYFEKDFPIKPTQERHDPKFCPFIKRKKVRWLKKVRKNELDSNLYTLLYSQHTISHADKKRYAHYIDRTIDSVYIKGETAHLVLNVKQEGDINALSFANIIRDSVKIIDEFKHLYPEFDDNIDGKRIKIKANVQSPGPMELFGPVKELLMLTSIITDIYGININTFKIIGFWKKKQPDKVKEVRKLLEDERFRKYKERQKQRNETSNDLQENLAELGVENPMEDVNSTRNLDRHEGIIGYELT